MSIKLNSHCPWWHVSAAVTLFSIPASSSSCTLFTGNSLRFKRVAYVCNCSKDSRKSIAIIMWSMHVVQYRKSMNLIANSTGTGSRFSILKDEPYRTQIGRQSNHLCRRYFTNRADPQSTWVDRIEVIKLKTLDCILPWRMKTTYYINNLTRKLSFFKVWWPSCCL